ncbi:UDP-glycosyltransferase UGT5 [Diabrotica virgifera virgifera]|uniref:UDP-glucuronosyltransferase n=1 Tax=Diabrotica virgifera virgifera TaxID=50390 RepID=A0A6P7GVG2_DIAVI|nr:UDP-glycosyltransferase UGT5 [Diabrotica virgifera virgifera]
MYSKITAIFSLLVFCSVSYVNPLKILGVFPYAGPSHYFLGNELLKGMAAAGHDVTMITVFEDKNPPKKGTYRQLILQEVLQLQYDMFANMSKLSGGDSFSAKGPFGMLSVFSMIGLAITEGTLSHPTVQALIKSDEKFDVMILTQFAVEGTKALAAHFGAHLVLFNDNAATCWVNHFVGNSGLPSLNPELVFDYPQLMNFKQRLTNTLYTMAAYLYHNYVQYPAHAELIKKYVSKDMDLTKIQYNVSLVLSNSHPSLNNPAASVPNMKEIAGYHVKEPKPLPADLKKYLDESKNGVIYFSMGSTILSSSLPKEKRESILKAFSKRKENVLWKFEDENLPGKPKNVRIEKWLPQSDLLAHPNVKLFITHGGFLSTIETMYHGIPTVSVPVINDQKTNARQAEKNGISIVVDYNTLTEEQLSEAIEEILSNPRYRENAKARSKIFHDRPLKPMEEAVYWVEYITRHNGAKHLRVGYVDLAWYQYYLLDVFGFIFGALFLALYVIRRALCSLYCLVSGGTAKKVKIQ